MDLTPTDDQRALVDAFGGFLAKESTPAVVRAAEPLGHDPALWAMVVDLGVPMMGAPEAAGGGATLLDLALVGEQVGRQLAPLPYVEAIVATRLLAAAGAAERVERANAGEIVTFAVRPPVAGVARLVPAGAVAASVVVLDGDELVVVPGGGAALGNTASAPLADVALDGPRTVLATGAAARRLQAAALDEWRSLTASLLAGLAAAALEIGVAYTKQREQFGKPIAAFQSIAHRLADDATDVQGLQLLTRKAAWALDEQPADGPRLAAMAHLWAGEVANRVAGNSLHFHGGYGFMLEYDIQLFLRRAKLWSVVGGDPRSGYAELGRQLFGAVR
ncbi:MAG: acyl-CoA dehydrogenase family protein [Acidimicrobiia bacterium]